MSRSFLILVCVAVFGMLPHASRAATLISTDDAGVFFNTVAARLLRAETGADLNRIEVYPINRYTPEVHRLLQLSANLYECTTNNPATGFPFLPRVYRPLLTNDSRKVFICGYTEESGTNLLARALRDLSVESDRENICSEDRVLGLPVVVGVRKGFPNFNEIAADTVLRVTRKLRFHRSGEYGPLYQTNVSYLVEITNVFGLECWNPYTNAFPRDLQLMAAGRVTLTVSNEHGLAVLTHSQVFNTNILIPANTWPGFIGTQVKEPSFLLPVSMNWTALPVSRYSYAEEKFLPNTNLFETLPIMPVPLWNVQLRASVDYALIDPSAQAIVDYVNLDYTRDLNLTATLALETPGQLGSCSPIYTDPSGTPGSLFCTNRYMLDPSNPTIGMLNQILVGAGRVRSTMWPMTPENEAAAAYFNWQMLPYHGYTFTNVVDCPFSPTRTIYLSIRASANDPLVHHTKAQLQDPLSAGSWSFSKYDSTFNRLGVVNSNYEPWDPLVGEGVSPYNSALKDPSVGSADKWEFPENQRPDLSWVARVHRGTPWQTVYWKSEAVSPYIWEQWIKPTAFEGPEAFPTYDWGLVELLAPLFNTNYPDACASVNKLDAAGWASLMDGLVIYTNDANHGPQPLTISGESQEALAIGAAIVSRRENLPGGWFRNAGEVFGVTDLSDSSPWQIAYWPYRTEASVEGLAAQLAGKLRSEPVAEIYNNPPTLQFSAIPGSTYRIDSSTDLSAWTPITTKTAASYTVTCPFHAASEGAQFFRAVLLSAP